MATATIPFHKTTIDQHQGAHEPTGLPIFALKDVITDFSDYSQERWDSLGADDQEWWSSLLEQIHAAMVDLESLPDEQRSVARDYLTGNPADDAEACPAAIREAIAHATGG